MNSYKPEFLGKVIPADDTSKMRDFVNNKFDSFSKIYDTCKDSSNNIKDIQVVETPNNNESLSVKVSADKETLNTISEKAKKDSSISVNGDVITAK